MSSPSLPVVEEFILLCKKHGIARARYQDVEIDFGRPPSAGPDAKGMEEIAKALADGTLTDEQALFGSAPQPVAPEALQEMLKRYTGGR